MFRHLLALLIVMEVGFSSISYGWCSPWAEYRTQVDSIFRVIDDLNVKVRTIHIDYSEKRISPQDAVSQMRPLIAEFYEVESRVEGLKPPPQWERYHESLLKVSKLTIESVENLNLYFEAGAEENLKMSLSLVRTIVQELEKLTTLLPIDRDPPVILSMQRKPPNPSAHQSVEVTADARDLQTGLGRIYLNYTVNDGNWTVVSMRSIAGSDWNGTWAGSIPGQIPGSRVAYEVVVGDRSGNTVRSEVQTYTLANPFTLIPIILAASIALLLVLIRARSRRSGGVSLGMPVT